MDKRTEKDVENIIERRNPAPENAKILRGWAERLWYGFQKRFGEITKENYQELRHRFLAHAARQRLRILCVIHYGGDPPKCACCGESHLEFLTIDHHGTAPDKKWRSGDRLYRMLIKKNFPEGFRVLCMNCNHYIGHYGWCPHEWKRP
jgi:hypothetical protein